MLVKVLGDSVEDALDVVRQGRLVDLISPFFISLSTRPERTQDTPQRQK